MSHEVALHKDRSFPIRLFSFQTFVSISRNFLIYIRFPFFFFLDFFLGYFYLFYYSENQYLQEKKNSEKPFMDLTYGELPYHSFRDVLKHIKVSSNSTFIDLGCGKGKLVFYMNKRFGMRSIGYDVISTFIRTSKALVKRYSLKNIYSDPVQNMPFFQQHRKMYPETQVNPEVTVFFAQKLGHKNITKTPNPQEQKADVDLSENIMGLT